MFSFLRASVVTVSLPSNRNSDWDRQLPPESLHRKTQISCFLYLGNITQSLHFPKKSYYDVLVNYKAVKTVLQQRLNTLAMFSVMDFLVTTSSVDWEACKLLQQGGRQGNSKSVRSLHLLISMPQHAAFQPMAVNVPAYTLTLSTIVLTRKLRPTVLGS